MIERVLGLLMLIQKVRFGFGQVITITIGLRYDRGDTNNSSSELLRDK